VRRGEAWYYTVLKGAVFSAADWITCLRCLGRQQGCVGRLAKPLSGAEALSAHALPTLGGRCPRDQRIYFDCSAVPHSDYHKEALCSCHAHSLTFLSS